MASINDVVSIVMHNSSKSVTQAGFGTMLFITDHVPETFKDVCRIYKSANEMISDTEGFKITDNAYLAASCYFAQEQKPSQIIIAPKNKDDDFVTALNKISLVNSDWYAVTTYSKTHDDIKSISKYINTLNKLYFVSCSDKEVLIAAELNKESIDRTSVLYSSKADKFPECGWLASGLAVQPGTQTFAYKNISTIAYDNLSSTDSITIHGKNANTYEFLGGQPVTRYGKLTNGDYIDIKMSLDFISARIQESVYSTIINTPKIPYTEKGIAAIENQILGVCEMSSEMGLVADYKVIMPKISNINKYNKENKKNRLLDDILINLTMSGAIHTVKAQINYQI